MVPKHLRVLWIKKEVENPNSCLWWRRCKKRIKALTLDLLQLLLQE
jgi:hypothetical protein